MRAVRVAAVAVVLALLGLLVWDVAHGNGGGVAKKVDDGRTVPAPTTRLPLFSHHGTFDLASYRGPKPQHKGVSRAELDATAAWIRHESDYYRRECSRLALPYLDVGRYGREGNGREGNGTELVHGSPPRLPQSAAPDLQLMPIDGSPAPCWLALVDPAAGVMFSGAG